MQAQIILLRISVWVCTSKNACIILKAVYGSVSSAYQELIKDVLLTYKDLHYINSTCSSYGVLADTVVTILQFLWCNFFFKGNTLCWLWWTSCTLGKCFYMHLHIEHFNLQIAGITDRMCCSVKFYYTYSAVSWSHYWRDMEYFYS